MINNDKNISINLFLRKVLFSILLIEFLNIQYIFSNSFVTIPFSYINKQSGNSFPDTTTPKDYFESLLNYSVYTSIKINDKNINFHITLDRHATYISEKSYKEIEKDSSQPNNEKEEKLYSLDYIGINRAKFKNSNFSFLFNNTKNIVFNNYSFFVTTKMSNVSDYIIEKKGYANESDEIGFNIVKGNKYDTIYVEPYNPYYDNDYLNNENKFMYKSNVNMLSESFALRNDGYNIEEKTNLVNQLKMRELISSYFFSIKIDENEEKGNITIGGFPHEIDKKHYNEKYYIYDTISVGYGYFRWHYQFEDIIYDGEKLPWVKDTDISLNFGFILSPYNYQEFLDKKFFNNVTYSDYCREEKVGEYYFVKYCQEKVIKYFKPIYFCLSKTYLDDNQTNYIEFTYKDLFVKAPGDNDLYYFQMIFIDNSYKWIFGRPLFKKYQTVFNQDKKLIGFYTETGEYKYEENENSNKNPEENKKNPNNIDENKSSFNWVLLVILICLLCSFIVIAILLYKVLTFNKRKKKANELEDNFDYTPSQDNEETKNKNQDPLLIN